MKLLKFDLERKQRKTYNFAKYLSNYKITSFYVDFFETHCILTLPGNNIIYINLKYKRAKRITIPIDNIGEVENIKVTSCCWNTLNKSDKETGFVILATNIGLLLKVKCSIERKAEVKIIKDLGRRFPIEDVYFFQFYCQKSNLEDSFAIIYFRCRTTIHLLKCRLSMFYKEESNFSFYEMNFPDYEKRSSKFNGRISSYWKSPYKEDTENESIKPKLIVTTFKSKKFLVFFTYKFGSYLKLINFKFNEIDKNCLLENYLFFSNLKGNFVLEDRFIILKEKEKLLIFLYDDFGFNSNDTERLILIKEVNIVCTNGFFIVDELLSEKYFLTFPKESNENKQNLSNNPLKRKPSVIPHNNIYKIKFFDHIKFLKTLILRENKFEIAKYYCSSKEEIFDLMKMEFSYYYKRKHYRSAMTKIINVNFDIKSILEFILSFENEELLIVFLILKCKNLIKENKREKELLSCIESLFRVLLKKGRRHEIIYLVTRYKFVVDIKYIAKLCEKYKEKSLLKEIFTVNRCYIQLVFMQLHERDYENGLNLFFLSYEQEKRKLIKSIERKTQKESKWFEVVKEFLKLFLSEELKMKMWLLRKLIIFFRKVDRIIKQEEVLEVLKIIYKYLEINYIEFSSLPSISFRKRVTKKSLNKKRVEKTSIKQLYSSLLLLSKTNFDESLNMKIYSQNKKSTVEKKEMKTKKLKVLREITKLQFHLYLKLNDPNSYVKLLKKIVYEETIKEKNKNFFLELLNSIKFESERNINLKNFFLSWTLVKMGKLDKALNLCCSLENYDLGNEILEYFLSSVLPKILFEFESNHSLDEKEVKEKEEKCENSLKNIKKLRVVLKYYLKRLLKKGMVEIVKDLSKRLSSIKIMGNKTRTKEIRLFEFKDILDVVSEQNLKKNFKEEISLGLKFHTEKLHNDEKKLLRYIDNGIKIKKDIGTMKSRVIKKDIPETQFCFYCKDNIYKDDFIFYNCGHSYHLLCGESLLYSQSYFISESGNEGLNKQNLIYDDCLICGDILIDSIEKGLSFLTKNINIK